jgi:hypothetical protein
MEGRDAGNDDIHGVGVMEWKNTRAGVFSVNKRYQAHRGDVRSSVPFVLGLFLGVAVLLLAASRAWGTAWWINAIIIAVGVLALGGFSLVGLFLLGQWTLEMEVNDTSLRLRNWRGSRVLLWRDVSAWCAVEIPDGARMICLQLTPAREPLVIDPDLLDGKQFARIYRDIEAHCGPPHPGAEVLGDNQGDPFTDKRI